MALQLVYSTGIYKLGKRWATLTQLEGPANFPDKMALAELAKVIAQQQQHCFKEEDISGTATRLIEMFERDTMYLAFRVGQLIKENDDSLIYTDNVDQVTATMQFADHIGPAPFYHGNKTKKMPNQWWIHEICRYKNLNEIIASGIVSNVDEAKEWLKAQNINPVNDVMGILENIACANKDSIYLMVEKNPVHGSADFLLSLYSHPSRGYVKLPEEESYLSHYFMKKMCLEKGKSGGVRQTRKKKRRKRKTRKRKTRKQKTRRKRYN